MFLFQSQPGSPRTRVTAVLGAIVGCCLAVHAQTPILDPDRLAEIKRLAAEERWSEIVQRADPEIAASSDLNYYYGMALSRLDRWHDARRAFENGLRRDPTDKRFPLELAGVAFKQKNYNEAADYLRRALRLDPADAYAIDFLASIHFLQGNIAAAVKYWNRISKPQIEEVRLDPTPKVDLVLLDQAFTFAPAAILQLKDLQTTEARIAGLNILTNRRFDLEARSDGKFDLVFRGRERNGWGNTRLEGLLSLFRGLPFQTIYPEFFNIGHRAINSLSLVRWDSEKRRFWTSLSGPFFGDPKRRYRLNLDLRNENWEIRNSSTSANPARGRLNMRKQAIATDVISFVSGRFDWSTGVELSRRDFRDISTSAAQGSLLFSEGFQLKHLGKLKYELVQAPERRLTLTAEASTEFGRIWSNPSRAFAKVQSSLRAHWFPRADDDDYEIRGQVRAGKILGEPPFDELFSLGAERDNDLWLRAHPGTRDGRKGNAPLGGNYFLTNWEIDKNLYDNGIMNVKLGPFVDTGRIFDSITDFGPRRWLWDVGAQAKLSLLGVGFRLSYGKDLRAGNKTFYLSMVR